MIRRKMPINRRQTVTKQVNKIFKKKLKIEETTNILNDKIIKKQSFHTARRITKDNVPRSTYKSTGLNHKEKTFLICNCQSKPARFLNLKRMASNAIKEHKIFTVYGSCRTVRKSLVDRGWVEKIPERRMNLMKVKNGSLRSKQNIQSEIERLYLSSLVQNYPANFIWRFKDHPSDNSGTDITKKYVTIENRLLTEPLWTSKQGLCELVKRQHWFYIEDVAEVSSPRSYNTAEKDAVDEFDHDYKITACTSLLKWVLTKVSNNCLIFSKSGKISCNVLVFALNACKAYVSKKQNNDIDFITTKISNTQWNSYLRKYHCLIREEAIFKLDSPEKLPLYLAYARCLLEDIYQYRPQLGCEGCHNVWIIKPPSNSRGRGIRMASNLSVINRLISKPNSKFVVQKYIEEPALIHETKFDIRQYCLVTSTCPLIIWMYKDCYLKFSTQKYNLMNFHESIHLTNNAVQRKYVNCEGRHPDLPSENMWHSDTFKSYLNSIGKSETWDKLIYPAMRKAIIGIMLCSQDMLSVNKNRFELYGCDFIIDKMFQPWLIEINSGPDLQHTTSVTANICPAVIEDIMKVVIDYPRNRRCSTGNFERIYHQPFRLPQYQPMLDLTIEGYALPDNYFYKGNIPTKLSHGDEALNIKHADSSKTLVSKMKHSRGLTELFKQLTEEGKPVDLICKNTENEGVLSIQLEEFMESIITIKSKSSDLNETSQTSIEKLSHSIQKSLSAISIEFNNIKESSGSSLDKVYNLSHLYDLLPNSRTKLIGTLKKFKETLNSPDKAAKRATSKIFSFIIRKQKEYSDE